MTSIRKVVLAANGPVYAPQTWSNVPACLLHALKAKNIEVVTVNLAPLRVLKALYLICSYGRRRRYPDSSFDYFRSSIHQAYVRLKLKVVTWALHDHVPLIVLSFSFPLRTGTRPSVLISDWTYEHYIREHLCRRPDVLESRAIATEQRALQAADLVVSIFPAIAKGLARSVNRDGVCYLGHGVNHLPDPLISRQQPRSPNPVASLRLPLPANERLSPTSRAKNRRQSGSILFVGGRRYLEALQLLLKAFAVIQKREHAAFTIDVIGFSQASLMKLGAPPGVVGHGYLDKSCSRDFKAYQDLFSRASVFVNVSPCWLGFSSMLEALAHGIPAIVAPHPELEHMFPSPAPFLVHCAYGKGEQAAVDLSDTILSVINSSNYESISLSAQQAASGYTWDSFVSRLIARIEALPVT